jgi:hypothetical protein
MNEESELERVLREALPVIEGGSAKPYRCAKGCHLILVPEDGEPIYVPVENATFEEGLSIWDYPVFPASEEAERTRGLM